MASPSAFDLHTSKLRTTLPGLIAIIAAVIAATTAFNALATKAEVAAVEVRLATQATVMAALQGQLTITNGHLAEVSRQLEAVTRVTATAYVEAMADRPRRRQPAAVAAAPVRRKEISDRIRRAASADHPLVGIEGVD